MDALLIITVLLPLTAALSQLLRVSQSPSKSTRRSRSLRASLRFLLRSVTCW